jgi:hypothetical protein
MPRLKDKDGTPAWKWNKKASSVNVANLNPNIIQYFDTLPQEIQSRILATSGNDSGHAKTSRHYADNAIDLRYDDVIWQYVAKDPNRLKYGLTLLDPDHGSAKHIHLSHGDGSENKKDVWMNPYSPEARDIIGMQPTEVKNPNPTLVGTTNTQIIMNDTSKRDEFLKGLQDQIRFDSQVDAQQKQLIAQEQERQQIAAQRFQERNAILDAIGNNNLEFEGRNYKPNQQFADGGIVEGLDEDINFMIQNLKQDVPNFESPEYLALVQENQATQNRLSKNMELYDKAYSQYQMSQPTIINNETYGALPVAAPQPQVEANPEKVSSLSSTKGMLYSELKNLGLNNFQVAGVIGSLGGESHEKISHTARNSSSGAFGIAQWLGPRYRNLVKFSNEQGLDFNSPEAQVKFLISELKGSEKGTLNSILKTKNLSEATETWTRKYERPSEQEIRGSLGRRINFAQNFLNSIS